MVTLLEQDGFLWSSGTMVESWIARYKPETKKQDGKGVEAHHTLYDIDDVIKGVEQ